MQTVEDKQKFPLVQTISELSTAWACYFSQREKVICYLDKNITITGTITGIGEWIELVPTVGIFFF